MAIPRQMSVRNFKDTGFLLLLLLSLLLLLLSSSSLLLILLMKLKREQGLPKILNALDLPQW